MTKNVLTKLVINCETGEENVIPLTAEEIADIEEMTNSIAAKQAEIEAQNLAKEEAKKSAIAKLAALGLTEEEAAALAN